MEGKKRRVGGFFLVFGFSGPDRAERTGDEEVEEGEPRATPPYSLDRSAALRSAVSPSFLILYRSSSRRNPATSEGMGLDATSVLLLLYICETEAEGASVLSFPSPSSPSGTGLGGGAGCAYDTRSLDSRCPPCPWRRAR